MALVEMVGVAVRRVWWADGEAKTKTSTQAMAGTLLMMLAGAVGTLSVSRGWLGQRKQESCCSVFDAHSSSKLCSDLQLGSDFT